ncbi:unnamed protein product [Mesocestoides corti]|uniref:C2H2-type domain-containing protein n=1 Tax=Mesocestoides corti TaxID=53468 RepID=A0A3P6GZL8_MESCO|nr:unnamed protein product [Mesocestoides corti]
MNLTFHFKGHRGAITNLGMPSRDLIFVVSSSLDCTLMIWNIKPQTRAYKLTGHDDAVLCACFSSSGEIVASTKGESVTFRAHTAAVWWVDVSPDNKCLCTASSDKSVKVWNPRELGAVLQVNAPAFERILRFSPDSQLIASSSDDKNIRLWDCRNQECVCAFSESGGFANHIDFHPSGTCIASGSSASIVKIWDLRMKRLLHFHPTGNYLLSASEDSTLKIFDLLEGRPIYTLSGHKGAITAAVFSSSGAQFVSGGADEQVGCRASLSTFVFSGCSVQ